MFATLKICGRGRGRKMVSRLKGLITLLFLCTGPLFGQYGLSEEWEQYIEYTGALFDEYYNSIEPDLNDHIERSSENFDAYMEKVQPYFDRMMTDPNYSFEEYSAATQAYRDQYFARSREEWNDYSEKTRPVQNAYHQASAMLRENFYAAGSSGGRVTQEEFDAIMGEFHRKSREEIRKSYRPAPDPVPAPPGKNETALQQRTRRYVSATGIRNRQLLDLYAGADVNRDNGLSMDELQRFQQTLVLRYAYIANSTALRPDEFIAAGGGDCEDWSIVTAGLLRFWGIEAYVGALEPGGNGIGHAVCLVRFNQPPSDPQVMYWEITSSGSLNGYYMPVDYQFVGTLSSTLFSGWRLTSIYRPEEIYGVWM